MRKIKNGKAIIFGISGQDGSYLADHLLKKKYEILGITRKINKKNLYRLKLLNIEKKIKLIKGNAINFSFVKELIKNNKNIKEIYYLSGKSSVIKSFSNPMESFKSNTLGIFNILENVKNINKNIRVFNAASGQFYGNNKKSIYNEKSYINPQSPYGISKASSYWLVKIFREWYGIKCCSGILFNHESPLRSDAFVTKKIINHCHLIKKGKIKYLYMGDINISRDWGWAPEYVEVMYKIANSKFNEDFVVATGKNFKLIEIIKKIFSIQNLKIKNNLKISKSLFRKNEILKTRANINKIKRKLNWKSKFKIEKILLRLINEK